MVFNTQSTVKVISGYGGRDAKVMGMLATWKNTHGLTHVKVLIHKAKTIASLMVMGVVRSWNENCLFKFQIILSHKPLSYNHFCTGFTLQVPNTITSH